jgi:hypothetical protein
VDGRDTLPDEDLVSRQYRNEPPRIGLQPEARHQHHGREAVDGSDPITLIDISPLFVNQIQRLQNQRQRKINAATSALEWRTAYR